MMRSPHLPARCTPAVNQCLEGAAGAATPREMRAAKGYLRFPEPLTVAAWNSQEPVSPSAALSHFQKGKQGSERIRDLVGATHQGRWDWTSCPALMT